MKNKRLLTVLLSLTLVVTLALALVASAENRYTGDLSRARQYLGIAVEETDGSSMATTLSELGSYLSENEIDPNTDGYAEFMLAYEEQKLVCLELLLDESDEKTTARQKGDALLVIVSFIDNNGLDADVCDAADFLAELNAAKLECANAYMNSAMAESTAAKRRSALALANAFITSVKIAPAPEGAEEDPLDALNELYDESVLGCAELFLAESEGSSDPAAKSSTLTSLGGFITEFGVDLTTEEGVKLADKIDNERFACATSYLSSILATASASKKVTLLYELQSYLESYDMPESDPEASPEEDKYLAFAANYESTVVSCAQALVDALADEGDLVVGNAKETGEVDVLANGAAARMLNEFISTFPELFPEVIEVGRLTVPGAGAVNSNGDNGGNDGGSESDAPENKTQLELDIEAFYADYRVKIAAHNDAIVKNRDYLYSNALYTDRLEGAPAIVKNFNVATDKFDVSNLGYNQAQLEGYSTGDGYFTIRYLVGNTHTFPHVTVPNSSRGVVIEFDITTFGTLPGMSSENGSYAFPIAGTNGVSYFSIDANGGVTCTDVVSGDKYTRENVIGRGGWSHISLVYRPDCYMTLYVDYVEIGTYRSGSVYATQPYETYVMGSWRLGTTNAVNKEFSLDNFVLYTGTSVRDPYEEISAEQRMILMADALKAGATVSSSVAKTSYDYVSANIISFFNDGNANGVLDEGECLLSQSDALYAEMTAAIENYLDFIRADAGGSSRYTALLQKIKDDNEAEYYALIKTARDQERRPSTLSYRSALLLSAQSFLDRADVRDNITMGTKYQQAVAWRADIEAEMEIETWADEYTKAIGDFFALEQPTEIVNRYSMLCDLTATLEANADYVALLALDGYLDTYGAAYERFKNEAEAMVSDVQQISNAQQFIALMKYAASFAEDTWEANFKILDEIITTARALYNAEGKIDKYYTGFAAAEATYNKMNPYFYGALQDRHEQYLSVLLERYEASNSFSERVGICASAQSYIANNDIDGSRESLATLVEAFREHSANVRSEEAEYVEFIKGNVERFLKLVIALSAADDYNEIVELLAECDLYSQMVYVGAEGVIDGILYLDEVHERVERARAATASFKAIMAQYDDASSEAERFALLCSAAGYADGVEPEIEGAEAALAKYNSELSAMKAKIQAKNDELIGALGALGTLVGLKNH